MKQLKVTYVEDRLEHYERYGMYIRNAWEKIGLDIPFDIQRREDPIAFVEELSRGSDLGQLLFIDIRFPETVGKPSGTELNTGLFAIKQAREQTKCGVIAISQSKEMLEDARRQGAHDCIFKPDLDNDPVQGSANLQKVVRRALTTAGYAPYPIEDVALRPNPADMALNAVVEDIGRDTLKIIACQLLGAHLREARLDGVAPGKSGASVIRLSCDSGNAVPQPRAFFLKLSRNRKRLEEEHRNRELAKFFPNDTVIPAVAFSPEMLNWDGWYAIATEFQDDAVSLLEWLTESPATEEHSLPQRVTGSLEVLFGNRLRQVYEKGTRVDTSKFPCASYYYHHELSRNARGAHVLAAVEELEELAAARSEELIQEGLEDEPVWDRRLIEQFLKKREIGQVDFDRFPQASYGTVSHGDLHLRNVIVLRSNGDPRIIDLAKVKRCAPRALDVSRLTVDVFLSGLDRGRASYEWQYMARWVTSVRKFARQELLTCSVDDPSQGCLAALNWMGSNVEALFGNRHPMKRWEYHLALAVEFLLASYRTSSLTAPKRVLALLAACISLRTSAERVEKSE